MIFELLQLVVTLILSIISISDGSQRNCAGTSSCPGGGIQIEAPFWIPSDTAYTGCTYPGFAIKCEGARPLMNISNHLYYVLDIHSFGEGEGVLKLTDPDMDGEKCPRPRHNVSLQSQPFLSSYGDYNFSIFYNCTIPPGNGWYQLICLENSYNNKTRRSYAFPSDPNEIPQEFQHWYNYCEESVVVPAYFDGFTNFSKSIESYELSYRGPVDCEDCVRSGGRCSANQTATGGAFSCECPRIGTLENDICYRDEGERETQHVTHSKAFSISKPKLSNGGLLKKHDSSSKASGLALMAD